MPKFRRKVPVIDAVRFSTWDEHRYLLPDGVEGIPSYSADNWSYVGCKFYLNTPEGRVMVFSGDWIIYDPTAGTYVCKDEIFRATYEEVTE